MPIAFPQEFPVGVFVTMIGIIFVLRLVRWARLNTPAASPAETAPPSPTLRRCLWGPARKIEKIAETTALTRAHAELFHSKIDEVQARHDLDRLVAELHPPAAAPPAHQPPAAANNPAALTLPEIQQLLAVLDLDEDTRTDLLRLVTARLAEKRS